MNAPAPGGGNPDELAAAAEALGPDDVALLEQLGVLWGRHDPVPDGLAARLKFALTLDALETEVATPTSSTPPPRALGPPTPRPAGR